MGVLWDKVKRWKVNKYDIDLSYEHKTGCPRCIKNGEDRSRNNLHVYGKGRGAFCWACEFTIPSDEWLEQNGEVKKNDEEEFQVVGSYFDKDVNEKIKKQTGVDSKNYRGIRTETSRPFGVRYAYSEEDGSVVSSYYPTTEGYEISGYKVRHHPKRFEGIGETGKDCELFMQFAFKNTTEQRVVIAAGEIDALSCYQMLADYQKSKGYEPIPVVSATIGESGSHKQIQAQYEWFSRFTKIIICADQDEAGKKAVDKIAKVLPKGKVFVMTLPMKDANELLVNGKEKQFVNCFFTANSYTPDGIVGSGELMEKIKEAALVPKIPLPPFMHRLQNLMAGGIPLGTILTMGSMSGAGKSTISEEMVYYWVFHSPHKIGIVSLESDCAQYGTKILSRHISKKIDLIDDSELKVNFLSSEEVEQKAQSLFRNDDGTHRFHLIDERDGGLESLKNQIMELIVACDCRVIILDPLTDVLDGMSNDEQSVFMKWLKGMVKSHQVTFILISHVRKSSSGTKANSTGADLHEEDFMGSSSIFKSSACNLLFTRNKEHEDEIQRNVTTMKMTKCRWTGRTAPVAGQFFYSNETHTLYDYEDWLIDNPQVSEF